MNGKAEFNTLLNQHIEITRSAAKHFLKIGKRETSALIKHKLVVIDGQSKLKSTVMLLPIRRMYHEGEKLIDDDYITYEMAEDIEV